jgi:hypothetical protein
MTALEILDLELFDRSELLSSLRQTRLTGFDQTAIYADATIELTAGVDPESLAPAQRYLLRPTVETILALREALLPHGIDVFALEGGARIRTSQHPDERIPVIPPVVEESRERDGRTVLLIADGIHRVYAARSVGLPISVVTVRGLSPELPYYAYALDEGWPGIVELDELPDSFEKKEYRNPSNYRALFRQYNAVFPGVQKERKDSNPAHLRP